MPIVTVHCFHRYGITCATNCLLVVGHSRCNSRLKLLIVQEIVYRIVGILIISPSVYNLCYLTAHAFAFPGLACKHTLCIVFCQECRLVISCLCVPNVNRIKHILTWNNQIFHCRSSVTRFLFYVTVVGSKGFRRHALGQTGQHICPAEET